MSERLIASEADTQRAILDWLQAKRILAFRMNVGLHEVDGRRVRYGVPGMADILAFKLVTQKSSSPGNFWIQGPLPIWIEVKAPKGKQSDLQKSFQQQVESHGHRYVICRSLEDLQEALK